MAKRRVSSLLPDEPTWYKDAVIYELHVRAFADSNADGVGDFPGLIDKLDYLQDLGITAIWLLPFYPSPLKDDGYDIADYSAVNPAYGTISDFRRLLKEAHRRGIRVITELVINHTSSDHAWFQRARRAPKRSKHRNYYVWSDTPDRYTDARIIFKDFETSNWTWDPVAHAYYWHRFYSHQPDLNFDNPEVVRSVLKVLDFWMDLGVDGMRLDAVPYLYEREGTNCENLPETHAFLKRLRKHIDSRYKNRMLLGEANQWPEDAAAYFGDGDECHMNFHFPVMPRMFMAVHLEDSFPIVDILEQTPQIPDESQWATFLRNHDELTLEMVTDEDRDYMYRVYAADPQARINLGIRRRLAPLLRTRRKMELLNGLLFSLPGTPVLYYGDEIGMGDNIYLGDRNGVRTPMQWSGDRNAGFSRANPQRLYLPPIIDPEYHYEAINVETQQDNPSSFLWWMKRLIGLRKQHPVFGRGSIEFLRPENGKVLAFVRRYEHENLLVVANLSRFTQFVELDLGKFEGMVPTELFGHTAFPVISDRAYFLTLGPHSFFWFLLVPPEPGTLRPEPRLPTLTAKVHWEEVLTQRSRAFETALLEFMKPRRWFRGKAQKPTGAKIAEIVPISTERGRAQFLLVDVSYRDVSAERYVVPVAHAAGNDGRRILEERAHSVVARLQLPAGDTATEGVIYDALTDEKFAEALFASFGRKKTFSGKAGRLKSVTYKGFKSLRGTEPLSATLSSAEQSNTGVFFDDSFIMKVYRRVEPGINPDLEIGQLLTRVRFDNVPPLVGAIEHIGHDGSVSAVAALHGYVPNQGDAWEYTLASLQHFFDRALTHSASLSKELPKRRLLDLAHEEVPPSTADVIGGAYLHNIRLLGARTAELHQALSGATDDPEFHPEAFSTLQQRSLYEQARKQLTQNFRLLESRRSTLPKEVRSLADAVLGRRSELDAQLGRLLKGKIDAKRIRCHGDYHLGQVLFTGKDFVILDFEGEPGRPLTERRFKRSPLRDVAGMLRSFHYAAVAGLRRGSIRPDDMPQLEPWDTLWHRWVSATFLKAYLETAGSAPFIPKKSDQIELLLDYHLLEKCTYELGYELNNRPDWVVIPLVGLMSLLHGATDV